MSGTRLMTLQMWWLHETLSRMNPTESPVVRDRRRLHPPQVHTALGNKIKWEMMSMMADGRTPTARQAS